MKESLANFKKYYPLLREFVKRDFKIKYRRSVLGVLWSVLNPLGMMIIMSVVFSKVFRQGIENFPVYLMCGQLTFSFFNEASSGAMNSVINNGNLIKKVYIPKYLLPLSSVCSSLVNLMTSFIALLIVMVLTLTPTTWRIVLVVFPILFVLIFSYGLGLILCVVATSFRDMQHLYGVLTTAWMYLTPIFYPLSMLPKWVRNIIEWNPLTVFVEMVRDVVLYGVIPDGSLFLKSIMYCSIVMILGIIMFKKKQNTFVLKL